MLDKIVEFWNSHGTALMTFVISGGVALATFLVAKFGNKLVVKLVNYFVNILMKLFGGSSSLQDVNDKFNELPFVNELKDYSKTIGIDLELKYIELKRKLLSPKLSELERKAFQFEFDMIGEKIGKALSEKTIKMLTELEEISRREGL